MLLKFLFLGKERHVCLVQSLCWSGSSLQPWCNRKDIGRHDRRTVLIPGHPVLDNRFIYILWCFCLYQINRWRGGLFIWHFFPGIVISLWKHSFCLLHFCWSEMCIVCYLLQIYVPEIHLHVIVHNLSLVFFQYNCSITIIHDFFVDSYYGVQISKIILY